MERVVIFPGSFDPFTRGHESVVEEALTLFDRVVIAIGHNVTKSGLLTVENRKRLIDELYLNNPRVECHIYTSLTGEFATQIGAQAMIRGVRNTIDFEGERTLDAMNRELFPHLRSIFLFTPAELSHISSSAIRELLKFNTDVSKLLPKGVDINKYL